MWKGGNNLSVTDDVSSQIQNKTQEGLSQAIQSLPNALSGAKGAASGAVSGIVFIVRMPVLTTQGIMSIVRNMSHNPKYSKQNVSIAELGKRDEIKKIDEGITQDVMKPFDKICRKYGITYSAVVDKSNPRDPTYYVFFKGKETPVIEQALKEAYKSYLKKQANPRISIRAKLAFFRKRVIARDQQQQNLGKEKNNNIAGQQR